MRTSSYTRLFLVACLLAVSLGFLGNRVLGQVGNKLFSTCTSSLCQFSGQDGYDISCSTKVCSDCGVNNGLNGIHIAPQALAPVLRLASSKHV